MIAPRSLYRKRARPGDDLSIHQRQMFRQVMIEFIAPLLGLQRQNEAAIALDVDGLDGVHLYGHLKTHGSCPNTKLQ